jgi:hypothetical protein
MSASDGFCWKSLSCDAWLVHEHGIEPHVAVFDKSARTDGTFSRDGFAYDHESDIYLCPGGTKLTTTGTLVNAEGAALDPRRRPRYGAPNRQIMGRPAIPAPTQKRSRCCSRSQGILNLGRLRLRGPNGAHDEFLLAATAQNLRMAKLIPVPDLKPAWQQIG